MIYNAYIRANVRKIICEEGINSRRALDFLGETPHGLIIDLEGREYTKEELEDAESIRPELGIREDSRVASVGAVHEDTDSELFDLTKYYTKPGTERDN